MAYYMGEDRNGRPATLVDNAHELMPLTLDEYELLRSFRDIEDAARNGLSDEQRELAIRVAVQRVTANRRGWVLLDPYGAEVALCALESAQENEPEGPFIRECWSLVITRFNEVR